MFASAMKSGGGIANESRSTSIMNNADARRGVFSSHLSSSFLSHIDEKLSSTDTDEDNPTNYMSASRTHLPRIESMEEKGRRLSEGSTVRSGIRQLLSQVFAPSNSMMKSKKKLKKISSVHRNWKAIAHNLPLSQWYKEKTSQWTLDYPPFFAYFEKFLGRFASFIGMDDILSIQSDPLMNNRVLYFMRSTVLASDFLYLMATVAISSMMSGIRSRNYLFILLSTHTMFILLDNIHFQHIYLYYAPGVSLLVVLLLPFIFSLTPFLISSSDPLDALQSIISRLFPIQRGLTHAYWAPNAWAIYNTADLVLNKVMSKAGIHLSQPEYTSGLVQYAIFSPLLLDLTMIVSSSLSPLLFSTPELPLRLAFMLFQRQYLDDSCIRSVEREDVVIVAAVDIEVTSKDPTLAVISAVFFDINKGMKLESFSEVIPYPQLYIPHFLALSEEPHVCELMKKVMKDRPELKPQVIICDGNGRFHPRRFGLACHVAASTGIPTIGVSKNMDWGVIGGDMNGRKVYGERLKKLLSNLPQRLGSSPLDFFLPHTLNVISYPKSTKHVFVSSGLGISLETSTQIILELMGKGIAATAEADNLARRIASQISSL
eukprot:PDM84880.1 hypothetical protein PRIPAC_33903 [Pristionchus pacificus]